MDLAYTLVKHITSIKFGNIPSDAVEGTKKIILDQLAVALEGSSARGSMEVAQEVIDWGGKPESTIWVHGNKVPIANAAFANSVMAHGWDHDDTYLPTIVHTGVMTVPAALAVSWFG